MIKLLCSALELQGVKGLNVIRLSLSGETRAPVGKRSRGFGFRALQWSVGYGPGWGDRPCSAVCHHLSRVSLSSASIRHMPEMLATAHKSKEGFFKHERNCERNQTL